MDRVLKQKLQNKTEIYLLTRRSQCPIHEYKKNDR